MIWGSRILILIYDRIAEVPRGPWTLCVSAQHFGEHLDVLRRHRRLRFDKLQASE
jgi:hypothetical protein